MVEVLIASAILAFAVSAIAQSISAGQMQTYEAMHDLRAMSLVEALMEEIQSKEYEDPQGAVTAGPDSGETTRALYDNADDYHGFTETQGNCADAAAVAYGGNFVRFSRSATATYGSITVTGLGAAITGLTVTVTVTDHRGMTWTSTRFIPQP